MGIRRYGLCVYAVRINQQKGGRFFLENYTGQTRMKKLSLKLPTRQGFALISALSIMVLLVMVIVGMLTLSTSEARKSKLSKYKIEAQANARMALMVALGELQKSLGADQRVTVSSSVLDQNPETPEIDGLAHHNLMMVYDSWDTHLHGKKHLRDQDGNPTSSTISISDTYGNVGRHQELFKGYLVSHQDSSAVKQIDAAIDDAVLGLDGDNSIVLVRPVSTDDVDYIEDADLRAGLLDIEQTTGALGKYAWAVVGRNLPSMNTYESVSELAGLAGEAKAAESPLNYDVSTFDGASELPDDQEVYSKQLSQNTLDVTTTQRAGQRNFFKLSGENSYSILSDVRNGGLKKDINLLLESDWGAFDSQSIHPEYKSVGLGGATVEMPLCGIEAAEAFTPSNPNIPPTSWRQLRDYYRLYKDALNYAPGSLQWNGSAPSIDYLVTGDFMDPGWGGHHKQYKTPDTLGYHRSPVMSRLIYLVGLSSKVNSADAEKVDLYMHVSPVLVLWNPYSVSLRVEETDPVAPAVAPYSDFSIQAAFDRAFTVQYKLKVDTATSNWITPLSNSGVDGAGNYFDDIALTEGNNSGSNDVLFKPGEVRIFSMQKPVGAGGKVHLSPGFNNNVLFDETLRRSLATIPKAKLTSTRFSLRFADNTAKGLWGSPEVPRAYGADASAFGFESYGRLIASDGAAKESLSVRAPRGPKGGVLMDWFTTKGVSIIKEDPAEAARFPSPGSKPQSVAVFGMSLKGVEGYDESEGGLESSKPVANRTWLHSNPTQVWRHLLKPDQLKRTAFPYEIMYGPAVGNGATEFLQSDGKNAYIGPSITSAGVKYFTYSEIPISPVTSLAGFSGMRLTHARPVTPSYESTTGTTFGPNTQHIAHWGAAFGCGLGNSFAHPMISGQQVYEKHTGFTNLDGQPVFEDHYDTLFLANDALYDSWFCSSIAPQTSPAYDKAKSSDEVKSGWVNGSDELPNQRLKLNKGELNESQILGKLARTDAYKILAEHMILSAGFNVNNPHAESWKALLYGLKKRQVPYIDAETSQKGLSDPSRGLALSRFSLANSGEEGGDESDPASWTGIRYLTDDQIDKLAEEIARQVKLRGPFLNMSEFVNRRLSNDKFGVCGPLQAAIDHDDFDADFNGSGGGSSINSNLKSDIVDPDVAYEFPLAAKGSHYTGIPGYVMQADLLKAMGDTLTVRDDTFVIRSYGDARNAKGEVLARAWCEATVQRTTEYIETDATDNSAEKAAFKSVFNQQPVPTNLSDVNRKFGRKFVITSFRWVPSQELN